MSSSVVRFFSPAYFPSSPEVLIQSIIDLIARKKKDNPCGLYLANIAIDTTLGVFLLFLFLTFLNTRLSLLEPDSFRTGFYGRPFSYTIWAKQAAVYVAALGLMKAVVVALFWAIPGVFRFADWSLSWLSNDEAQVLFVMLIFPGTYIDFISPPRSKPRPDQSDSRISLQCS